MDARTDLWSLGAVLYEMIAGQVPFAGETPTETISLILQREAAPLSRYVDEVPAELERIVAKALTKDRDERYQTAKDFSIDLRNLKRKLEVDAEIDRSVPTEFRVALSTKSGPGSTRSASSSAAASVAPTGATGLASSESFLNKIRKHKVALIVIAGVLGLAFAAGALGWRAYRPPSAGAGPIDSIAVLPFANTSKDPNIEYLSDGLTESLISSLSQVSSLRVISRSAIVRYRDREVDAQTAGTELKVRTILKGGVKKLGDQLVISVELIDARDNHQIWGEQYVRKFNDVLVVQREIVKEVSGNLRLKLSTAEQQNLTKHGTENPEAYRLYLLGKYSAIKMTPDSFAKGISYLRQAIDLDPNYALAYSGLAFYYVQSLDQILPPKEAMPKSREAALKALSLDDSLAEAHVSLAYVYWQYDWDWVKAESEFRRALELGPRNPGTHGPYGFFLALMGRHDESLAEVTRASDLDPLSIETALYEAPAYYFARQYDEAVKRNQRVLDFAPDFWLPHLITGRAYEARGQLPQALAEFQKARVVENNASEILMDLGRVYGRLGQRAEAQKVLVELKARTKTGYVSPFQIAMVHIGLGEKDQAFAALEEACQARSWYMTWLKTAPEFDSIRADPRFANLAQRVGFK